jgi:hypothetical protein
MKNRIGRIADGKVIYPELSITGKPYGHAQDKRGLGDGIHFVILDPFMTHEAIETLLIDIRKAIRPAKRAKGHDESG